MARLYLDHNISLPLAPLLRRRGHAVIATRDLTLERAPDDVQLVAAHSRGLILVTHNADDFLLLHNAWLTWHLVWGVPPAPPHPGIINLEQRPIDELDLALEQFLRRAIPLANEMVTWRRNSGWWLWNIEARRWIQQPDWSD